MKLILASKSPRRSELMKMLGVPFSVVESDVREGNEQIQSPGEYVEQLAKKKAESVYHRYPKECVIGFDTVVYIDGEILGKPHTPENAVKYLKKLRGRKHTVYTGVCVFLGNQVLVSHDCTEVHFIEMTDAEIDWYVSTGDPLDKAGAYGIQGPAALFVDSIQGNYFNVVGLPISLLYQMLKEAGYPLLMCQNE